MQPPRARALGRGPRDARERLVGGELHRVCRGALLRLEVPPQPDLLADALADRLAAWLGPGREQALPAVRSCDRDLRGPDPPRSAVLFSVAFGVATDTPQVI